MSTESYCRFTINTIPYHTTGWLLLDIYLVFFSSGEEFPRQICWGETIVTQLNQMMRLRWTFKTCHQFLEQPKHAALQQTVHPRVPHSYFDRSRHKVTAHKRYIYMVQHCSIGQKVPDNRYMNVARLSALSTCCVYPPWNTPGNNFYYRFNRSEWSNDTTGNRTRNLPPCSAVPQPTAPPRAPNNKQIHDSNIISIRFLFVRTPSQRSPFAGT